MTQEERWQAQYDQMMAFIEENHRRPSKYKLEEHDMLNWFKSNKKMMNKGNFPEKGSKGLISFWSLLRNIGD